MPGSSSALHASYEAQRPVERDIAVPRVPPLLASPPCSPSPNVFRLFECIEIDAAGAPLPGPPAVAESLLDEFQKADHQILIQPMRRFGTTFRRKRWVPAAAFLVLLPTAARARIVPARLALRIHRWNMMAGRHRFKCSFTDAVRCPWRMASHALESIAIRCALRSRGFHKKCRCPKGGGISPARI